ncbi:MAG: MarR family transcriptional regulator [Firmicutes bacterium]|nr:MarR family transcriptional regulator [Bacillota bacterium]
MEQALPLGIEAAQSEAVLPLIQLISDLVDKRCDKFLGARYGLTTPQYQLLLAAVQNADVTLGGLSEQLNCSRGNVTGIVDRLERDEWLKRERSREDRRVISVRLTDKGHRVWEIQKDLARELAAVSELWDGQQRESLSKLLLRMYKDLKD